jgi:exopolysaccharide biosynthesis protein
MERYTMKKIKKNSKVKYNKKSDKRFSWKLLLVFILFQLIFTAVAAPFVLLYGPFENAKKTFVDSAMKSMHYQWLATTFLSDDKIAEITGENESTEEVETQENSLIEIPKVKDDSLKYQKLTGDSSSKFNGYALVISDPTRVKVGVTRNIGTEGETVSEIADNYDAVAAINGGYFTDDVGAEEWTANGGKPIGYLMSEGVEKWNEVGNDSTPIVGITDKGNLIFGDFTVAELKEKKVTEAMTYKETLVSQGKAVRLTDASSSPRTMIGQRKADGAIIFVVLDSKDPISRLAATLKEAQEVMIELGCWNAVNLDGGKSATMYLNDEVVNNPSYVLGERPIASGFIVKR